MGEFSNRLRMKAADNRIPVTAAFEISPVCNFTCKMCYARRTMEQVKAAGGLRSVEWWLNTAREAKKQGLLYLLLTGGEPFLYPDFRQLYEALAEMGMLLSINSNGSVINEEIAGWLEKRPPMRINITLYGASDETYRRLCGDPKGFTKVCKAVEILKKHGLRFIFNASITPENQAEVKEILEFGKKNNTPVRIATYMFAPVRRIADCFGKNDRLTPRDAGRQKAMVDYYQLSKDSFVRNARYYSQFTPLDQIDFETISAEEGRVMRCYAGRSSYWIDWQGNFSACGMIDTPKYSLDKYELAEAWKKTVRYIDEVRFAGTCVGCPNFTICNPCLALVYSETGDLSKRPEYHCKMMESAAERYKELWSKMEDV